MPSGIAAGFPKGVYGIGRRKVLYPGKDKYFRENPHVAGMAADDDKIIMNPYSTLKDAEKQAVMINEAARVHMRKGLMPSPMFDLTPDQLRTFYKYSPNMADIQQTIAARLLSGNTSAGKATPQQMEYVQQLRQYMGAR